MSNESARFASAIFVGVLVVLSPTKAFIGAARAADNCLSEPNGKTPAGKHWYYRIERGTERHCWYLRGEDEKPARAGASDSAPPATENSRKSETEATRSIANAHAQLPPRTRVDETITAPATPSAPPAPADVTGSIPAIGAASSPATSPLPEPSPLAQGGQSAVAAADESADSQPAAPESPAAQPAQAVERNIGSLQKLLLVAFGALALAGLTGSAVYRSAAGARARRKRTLRTTIPELADDLSPPPWAAPKLRGTMPRRVIPYFLDEIERPNDGAERIEDFLARLTKQLEAEMVKSRLH